MRSLPADVRQWWMWEAAYDTGEIIQQFDSASRTGEKSVDVLDKEKVKRFSLLPYNPARNQRIDCIINLELGDRFIAYWLVNVAPLQERRWVVGIERGGVTFLTVIDADCNTIITTNEDTAFMPQ